MEFRLTYEGKLLAHRDDKRLPERSLHVHEIRKEFHKQLTELWKRHPVLYRIAEYAARNESEPMLSFKQDGFNWLPLVTGEFGLICKLEVLMLRPGVPGGALQDVDNRLKTIFDALRMAKGAKELGEGTSKGQQVPDANEDPFYVLLEDDRLITHVAVTTDMLLQPVPNTPGDDAVRLVLDVTLSPYKTTIDNSDFS